MRPPCDSRGLVREHPPPSLRPLRKHLSRAFDRTPDDAVSGIHECPPCISLFIAGFTESPCAQYDAHVVRILEFDAANRPRWRPYRDGKGRQVTVHETVRADNTVVADFDAFDHHRLRANMRAAADANRG